MDDILIWGMDLKECNERLQQMLQKAREIHPAMSLS